MLNRDLKKKKEKGKMILSFVKELTYIILWPVGFYIFYTILGTKSPQFREPDSLTNKNSNDNKNS